MCRAQVHKKEIFLPVFQYRRIRSNNRHVSRQVRKNSIEWVRKRNGYSWGWSALWASALPCRLCPYPTLPYPRGLAFLWASTLPCRLWALPYPTLDMETVLAHGDSFGHPRGLGALWAGRTPSRLCPLTHGDSLCPWRQFIAQNTGMKHFMGKCPTLSPLPLNHGDSFTGRSTFIHVIPYTFICNRIPSNILQ